MLGRSTGLSKAIRILLAIGTTRKLPRRVVRGFSASALKRARKAAGLSQAEIAELSGIARENYVNFEKGHRKPGEKLIGRFAKALGVETRDLVRTPAEKMTLLDLRQLAVVSRAQATKALGKKSVTTYADMENGRTQPTDEQVLILANLYGVTPGEIKRAIEVPVRRRNRSAAS